VSNTTVVAKFKIKLGNVEAEVSKEEAEALYSALYAALNKSQPYWPVVIKEYLPTPNPWRWDGTIYSHSTGNNVQLLASDSISVSYQEDIDA